MIIGIVLVVGVAWLVLNALKAGAAVGYTAACMSSEHSAPESYDYPECYEEPPNYPEW